MADSPVTWRIEGPGAELSCGPLIGYASFLEELGFVVLKWNGTPIGSIGVLSSPGPRERSQSLAIDELYVRGEDLVASYVRTGSHCVVPQAYWRACFIPAADAVRIELVLSVRTELLDSAPTLSVDSYVAESDLFHTSSLERPNFTNVTGQGHTFPSIPSAEHLFLFRHRKLSFSYAEMTHPSDFVSAATNPPGHEPCCVESTLFPERLEKGVIRRGRICGWFMPAENDLETAVALARQFVDEPLPLTA